MAVHKRILSASSGLSVRLVLVAVFALFVLMVAYGLLSFVQARQKESERLRLDSTRTADRLESSLVVPVWNLDTEELGKELKLEMGCPDVQAIAVLRMDGSFIKGIGRDPQWRTRDLNGVQWREVARHFPNYTLARTLVNGSTAFADLQIIFTDQFLNSKLQRMAIQIFTLTFIFFILVLITLTVIYGNLQRTQSEAMLRRMASEIIEAEERERRKIATDFHDSVGQNLAMAAVKLETLKRTATIPHLQEIEAIDALIECSIRQTRSLTFELSPPILYELGLDAALDWLLERLQASQELVITFENTVPTLNLTEVSRVLLFRSVRELVLNAVKHSGATRLRVAMAVERDDLVLSVQDNGKGFEQDPARFMMLGTRGYGLFSIRERLVQMDGVLAIESEPGQGTLVRMTLPLGTLLAPGGRS